MCMVPSASLVTERRRGRLAPAPAPVTWYFEVAIPAAFILGDLFCGLFSLRLLSKRSELQSGPTPALGYASIQGARVVGCLTRPYFHAARTARTRLDGATPAAPMPVGFQAHDALLAASRLVPRPAFARRSAAAARRGSAHAAEAAQRATASFDSLGDSSD